MALIGRRQACLDGQDRAHVGGEASGRRRSCGVDMCVAARGAAGLRGEV